jgi:hypothetical protein
LENYSNHGMGLRKRGKSIPKKMSLKKLNGLLYNQEGERD